MVDVHLETLSAVASLIHQVSIETGVSRFWGATFTAHDDIQHKKVCFRISVNGYARHLGACDI
jgi:hypothetical protein